MDFCLIREPHLFVLISFTLSPSVCVCVCPSQPLYLFCNPSLNCVFIFLTTTCREMRNNLKTRSEVAANLVPEAGSEFPAASAGTSAQEREPQKTAAQWKLFQSVCRRESKPGSRGGPADELRSTSQIRPCIPHILTACCVHTRLSRADGFVPTNSTAFIPVACRSPADQPEAGS